MTDSRPVSSPDLITPSPLSPTPATSPSARGSAVIAETDRALELHEAGYPPCSTSRSTTWTRSSSGPANSTPTAPTRARRPTTTSSPETATTPRGAIWYYPEPYGAVDAIRGHVAFYADRVAITDSPRIERCHDRHLTERIHPSDARP